MKAKGENGISMKAAEAKKMTWRNRKRRGGSVA